MLIPHEYYKRIQIHTLNEMFRILLLFVLVVETAQNESANDFERIMYITTPAEIDVIRTVRHQKQAQFNGSRDETHEEEEEKKRFLR